MAIWPFKPEPYYIAILKYLEKKSNEGVGADIGQVRAHISSKYQKEISESAVNRVWSQSTTALDPPSRKSVLAMSAQFQLLEHEELKQARRSSFVALCIGVTAIVFTGITILLQVSDSNVVLLNAEQIKEIIRWVRETQ